MKNARYRAEEFLVKMFKAGWSWEEMVDNIEILLKEENNITRHACAEAINEMKDDHDGNVDKIDAFRLCISVKAV